MDISNITDTHKGKLCFIVGAGPSLHDVDVKLLQGHVVFAVNSSVLKLPFCDYFVTDDQGSRFWNYWQMLKKTPCIKALCEERIKKYADNDFPSEEVLWYRRKVWYDYAKKVYYPDGLSLTKCQPIVGARTSVGSAIHLAYIMGCDPIVLLGCDCCYSNGKRYYWQFDGEEKAVQLGGFLPRPVMKGQIKGNQIDDHSLEFIAFWRIFAQEIKKAGANVLNASGGILEFLPKTELTEVLKQFGDRRNDRR